VVLILSFFIGLEREEHKQRETDYAFGGVRTFPLIGLLSYSLALISSQITPWVVGFAAIAGFMLVSYRYKVSQSPKAGITSEMSGLTTYLMGGLIYQERYWIAATIAVMSVLLLELKKFLEDLATHVEPGEITTATKFLLLSVVILPIIPDHEFSSFQINPFKTWVIVVAVSGISYGSYLLQRLFKDRGGVFLSALLGGFYSSTVTTVVLAKRAKEDPHPSLFAGSILSACSIMYARIALLVALFNRALAEAIALPFLGLVILGGGAGWLISRRADTAGAQRAERSDPRNPLELETALLFAVLFVGIVVITQLAREHLGKPGLYGLAGLMGVTDVDPFILGITQSKDAALPVHVAAAAIVIAAASNGVAKAGYALWFADRKTGRLTAILLGALAAAGFLPLLWI
jgi:uncharacterized membrane protein (DUF4010 family)